MEISVSGVRHQREKKTTLGKIMWAQLANLQISAGPLNLMKKQLGDFEKSDMTWAIFLKDHNNPCVKKRL